VSRVERSALVARPSSHLFDLVNEVENYPRRFSWCESARILERDESQMLARLQLKVGALSLGFTTRNRLQRPELIELSLVEGPFRRLSGQWRFQALSVDACKVALVLDFEVAGRVVGSALAAGFHGLADRLVDDFCRAAREAA
jgi:ribosome-associated toxin RatA of RatAB toxin-antitoxin module